jgi:hypothetical protein
VTVTVTGETMDNYLKKLQDYEIPKGRVIQSSVIHDTWCALLQHKGECNCNPDIQFTELINGKIVPVSLPLRDKAPAKMLVIR